MSDPLGVAATTAAPNLLDAQSSQLISKLRAQNPGENETKIEKSASDFESILVGHWLEQAQQSFASVPGSDEDDFDDPGHSEFQSVSIQSLASAITASGGIGIARIIAPALRAADARQTGATLAEGKTLKMEHSQIGTNAKIR